MGGGGAAHDDGQLPPVARHGDRRCRRAVLRQKPSGMVGLDQFCRNGVMGMGTAKVLAPTPTPPWQVFGGPW